MMSRRGLMIGGGLAVLGLGGAGLALGPGYPRPLTDTSGQTIAGSLSEKVFLQINGTRQGLLIQSVDPSHPVLLFLHGGPGMPEFFLNMTHPTGLEADFTVVWWEQRGAGLSFDPDIPPDSMILKQFIADAVAVTRYLLERFGQEKIYLLGHSWGSYLGIQLAAASPDLFHAYIGMGQVSWQLRSEVAAHSAMLAAFRARGDADMVAKLEAAPVSLTAGLSEAYLTLRDQAMHGLGIGTTRDMTSVIWGVFVPVWRCPAYGLAEKVAIWRGMAFSRRYLWKDFIATDLTAKVKALDLPVYFLTGLYDYTANHDLARAFFDQITAPVKGFYTFRNSAHSPLFEEPAWARTILRQDVLTQKSHLADV